MVKNSRMYRRLWYYKNRNAKRIRIFWGLFLIFIILALLLAYAQKKIFPCVMEISQSKAKVIVAEVVNESITQSLAAADYEQLVSIDKDEKGQIISIQTNVAVMNRLAASINARVQERFLLMKTDPVRVPMGVMLGNPLLAGVGPDLTIKILPIGNVETEFNSEFTSAGVNQTRHRIYLSVSTNFSVLAPISHKSMEYSIRVPVAETVIVGKVPDDYTEVKD